MSVSALAATALMAAAPANTVDTPPASVTLIAPTLIASGAGDQKGGIPAAPVRLALPLSPAAPAPFATPLPLAAPALLAKPLLLSAAPVTEEPLPSAAATESLPPTPAAPPLASGTDEIVVTAQRRTAHGDPLEKVNAKSFEATEAVDKAFIGPVAHAYAHTVPKPIRNGLRNFLYNLDEPVAFLNFLLQHKPGKAAETLGRFALNSTVGVAGLFDVAKRAPFRLPRRSIGFADTLGYYGVKSGPFLFLPLIGPTTLRDLVGGGIDGFLLPSAFGKPFNRLSYTAPTTVLREFDSRNEFDEQLNEVRKSADPYAARRELYFKKRRDQIDGLRGKHRDAPPSTLTNPAVDPQTRTTSQAATPPASSLPAPSENPVNATPPGAELLPRLFPSAPASQTIELGGQLLNTPEQPASGTKPDGDRFIFAPSLLRSGSHRPSLPNFSCRNCVDSQGANDPAEGSSLDHH